jgi:hypothetical protein
MLDPRHPRSRENSLAGAAGPKNKKAAPLQESLPLQRPGLICLRFVLLALVTDVTSPTAMVRREIS